MRDVGLSATELGPEGFLPSEPDELTALLASNGLSCVGIFVPVLLHDADHDPLADIAGPLDALIACGADVLVLAAATGADGYDSRPTLDDSQWATLLANLDRLADAAADRGVLAVLHPHVGTMVETRSDVDRVLQGASIKLCLDTGHLLIGGTDPLALTLQVPGRIAHAHLKDVDAALAARVQAGELTYTEAVRKGMYTPLGAGRCRYRGHRDRAAHQRIRRLVRHGAGHHPRRRACRRGTGARRADQRGVHARRVRSRGGVTP